MTLWAFVRQHIVLCLCLKSVSRARAPPTAAIPDFRTSSLYAPAAYVRVNTVQYSTVQYCLVLYSAFNATARQCQSNGQCFQSNWHGIGGGPWQWRARASCVCIAFALRCVCVPLSIELSCFNAAASGTQHFNLKHIHTSLNLNSSGLSLSLLILILLNPNCSLQCSQIPSHPNVPVRPNVRVVHWVHWSKCWRNFGFSLRICAYNIVLYVQYKHSTQRIILYINQDCIFCFCFSSSLLFYSYHKARKLASSSGNL